MFKDDFIKYLFLLCLVILLLYIFQPSFWNKHPGLVRFFSPDYASPASSGTATSSSGARLSQTPSGSGYAHISGISVSSSGDIGGLRISVANNSPQPYVDLGGWQVKTSLRVVIIPAVRIPAGGTLTISSRSTPVSGDAPRTYYFGQMFLSLNDTISLYSKSGVLIEKYTY